MESRLAKIWQRRAILTTLVQRDLRVRYARSVLGYLWTVIDPLAMALTYFLFLLIGLLVWQWFNASVNETSRALQAEAKLVRSTNLPRELWVIRVVIAKGVEFLLSLPVLVGFVIFYMVTGDTQLNWRIIYLPLAVVLQFLLQVGIGLIIAPTTVLVDDTIRVIRIILRMMFYATPIIYVLDLAPVALRRVLWFNPLSGILELYRAGFFPNRVSWTPVVISISMTVAAIVIGVVVFARLERAVLKEI